MTREEIKLRQLANQHLTVPTGYETVVRDLCGVQAQFMSNALYAIRIRSNDFNETDVSTLVKSWTLRGTMHVFHQDDLPLFLHEGRSRPLRPCDTLEADEAVTKERKQFFADLIVKSIAAGVNTREELKEVCTTAGMTQAEAESIFNSWGGTIRALCERGRIAHVVQEKKAFALCPPFEPMQRDAARLEMARRYFSHFGPATIRDAAYFFGTTQAEVKGWLDRLPLSSSDCEGRTYYWIETGAESAAVMPECIFLAGFDQLLLGYQKSESIYLPPEHLRGIFNLAGIVMPAVLLRGRVIGKWKQMGKKVSVTLFETVGETDRNAMQETAARLWPDLKSVVFG